MLKSYNEMKVGVCIGTKPRGKATAKQYVSHLNSVHEFAPHLCALAVQAGLEEAKTIIVLGYGAALIWNLADRDFPTAIQILDILHVIDRLAKVARLAFVSDTPQTSSWLKDRREDLLSSNLDGARNALKSLASQYPVCAEATREELGCVNNNADPMDYHAYVAAGLSIGSGVAESSCKRIMTQRLKGAGMRWSPHGAQIMASLRCLSLSGHWHHVVQAWNTRTNRNTVALAV